MIKIKFTRKRLILAVAMLPFLFLSAQAFGQSAGVSGTITDASGAVLPGTTVTITNSDTGIKTTTTTNNAGVYNFASLPPGSYVMSAEMPGFQALKRTGVKLDIGGQLRINFEMQVSGIATQVQVTTSAQDLLLEATSTTGTIMDEKVSKDLPLVGNDLLQLVNVMGGVVKADNTIFGNSTQTFAGVMASNINITRDGISVNDARYDSGIVSPSRLNPEMVGEFKLILTPVDAEMGRGAGQVMVMTKSGGNEFHGSGVWSNINTALDAKEWNDNRTGTQPMWKNVNDYTISVGGPIIKNKTFFFVSWDHNIPRKREVVTATNVLTPCARKGIYRWWPGWIPARADAATTTSPGSQTTPSVNTNGTPLRPATNADGSAYSGPATVQFQSVLGQLTTAAIGQINADPVNCSQYTFGMGNTGVIAGTNWDPYRKAYDTSGYTDKFSAAMPMPNYYYTNANGGDGLNIAAFKWTRTTHGEDTVYGSGMDSARKSITVKLDHNLTSKHRLSGSYSYERSFSDGEHEPTWPGGVGGGDLRTPQTLVASLTSTLRPTLLNEFRFGLSYNMNRTYAPIDQLQTGAKAKELMQKFIPTSDWSNWPGLPVLAVPGGNAPVFGGVGLGFNRFDPNISNFYGGRLPAPGTWGSNDHRWTYSDTMTWTKGAHSLKFGGEFRRTNSQSQMNGAGGFFDSDLWFPYAYGGYTVNSPPAFMGLSNPTYWPGMVGFDYSTFTSGNYMEAWNLMSYMAGSIASIKQYYFVNNSSAKSWSDPTTPAGRIRYVRPRQNEFDWFFKDDWKVNNSLTLNLGIRYEYYGVVHLDNGMTLGVVGGAKNLFGGQSGGFSQWLQGVAPYNPTALTQQHFIGPGSANPNEQLFNKDLNNFGPAVGFAWQLPWFGKGKTTLRGGYQVSYLQISRLDPNGGMANVAGSQPGVIYEHTYGGDPVTNPYLDMSMLKNLVPTSRFWDGSVLPLAVRPLTDGTATASVYDPNVRSPYIQSLTMALTRQIGSALTVDVRYIGTLSRKQIGTINLNTNNWLKNGLKEAFDTARRGGESALLNTLMPPSSYVYGVTSGAAQLRASTNTQTNLAQGNYDAIASILATSNGNYLVGPATQGELVRRSGLGENFIWTNRQFATANWNANLYHTNYHSMQAQVSLRPTHGLSLQATYTWSRNLGDNATGTITDPLNRAADYGVLSNQRSHMLTTYGTFNLPLGSSGFAFRNSSAWVQELVEGWQLSWVSSYTSGNPYSITGVNSMMGGSGLDLVDPHLFNPKDGHVTWASGARAGSYFGNKYTLVSDPQCSGTDVSLQTVCQQNLHAIALASDTSQIVFEHAQPGVRGSFQPDTLTSVGRWSLDMAIGKNFKIRESKSINVRIDVSNIFNHPTPSGTAPFTYDQRTYAPGNPVTDLTQTANPFGYVPYKVGHRVFSLKARINF